MLFSVYHPRRCLSPREPSEHGPCTIQSSQIIARCHVQGNSTAYTAVLRLFHARQVPQGQGVEIGSPLPAFAPLTYIDGGYQVVSMHGQSHVLLSRLSGHQRFSHC